MAEENYKRVAIGLAIRLNKSSQTVRAFHPGSYRQILSYLDGIGMNAKTENKDVIYYDENSEIRVSVRNDTMGKVTLKSVESKVLENLERWTFEN